MLHYDFKILRDRTKYLITENISFSALPSFLMLTRCMHDLDS